MLKFTLMKQLYFAFDPEVIPEVRERRACDIFHRVLDVENLNLPGVHEVEVQERYLPYSQLYRIYFNDEQEESDIKELRTKEFVVAFFRHYYPQYLKSEIPEELADVDILELFEVDRMPSYQQRYAYRDLISMEDIRSGKEDKAHQKHGFPGLIFADKYKDKD